MGNNELPGDPIEYWSMTETEARLIEEQNECFRKRLAELEAENQMFMESITGMNGEIAELEAKLAEVIAMTPVMRSLFKWKKMEAKHTALQELANALDDKWNGLVHAYGGKSKMEIIKMRDDLRKFQALFDKESEDG